MKSKLKILSLIFILLFNLSSHTSDAYPIKNVKLKINQKKLTIKPRVYCSTVNDDGKIVIYWDSQPNSDLSYYNIYRDSVNNKFNQWNLIAKVFERNYNFFVDNSCLPEKKSYVYKISVVDKCGNEYFCDVSSSTIHLNLEKTGTDSVKLSWNKPMIKNISSYNILKGENANQLSLLKNVDLNDSIYFDSITNNNYFYQIQALIDSVFWDSDGKDIKILSNIQPNVKSRLKNIIDPAKIICFKDNSGNLNITFPFYDRDKFFLNAFDITGRKYYYHSISNENLIIPMNDNFKGILILSFIGSNYQVSKKIIIF